LPQILRQEHVGTNISISSSALVYVPSLTVILPEVIPLVDVPWVGQLIKQDYFVDDGGVDFRGITAEGLYEITPGNFLHMPIHLGWYSWMFVSNIDPISGMLQPSILVDARGVWPPPPAFPAPPLTGVQIPIRNLYHVRAIEIARQPNWTTTYFESSDPDTFSFNDLRNTGLTIRVSYTGTTHTKILTVDELEWLHPYGNASIIGLPDFRLASNPNQVFASLAVRGRSINIVVPTARFNNQIAFVPRPGLSHTLPLQVAGTPGGIAVLPTGILNAITLTYDLVGLYNRPGSPPITRSLPTIDPTWFINTNIVFDMAVGDSPELRMLNLTLPNPYNHPGSGTVPFTGYSNLSASIPVMVLPP
jgi:hypothetical protein